MKNEQNYEFYYVDDIECGVLISGGRKNSPAKKVFPEEPTVTFLCGNVHDATEIAKLILTKQSGKPIYNSDFVIDVNGAWWSESRCSEKCELKLR